MVCMSPRACVHAPRDRSCSLSVCWLSVSLLRSTSILSSKYLPCCWFLCVCVDSAGDFVSYLVVVVSLAACACLLGCCKQNSTLQGWTGNETGLLWNILSCLSLITWPSCQSLDGIRLLYFTLLLLSSVLMLDTQTPYVTCMNKENSHRPVQCGPHPFYLVFTNLIVSIVIV